jgi:hypothetical protein
MKKGVFPRNTCELHHLRIVPGVGAGGLSRDSVTYKIYVHESDLQELDCILTKCQALWPKLQFINNIEPTHDSLV